MMELKKIDGFDIYAASENGEIINTITGASLIGGIHVATGYRQVTLKNGSIQKSFLVHRLIAMCFCHHPDGADEVNHKNGDKLDNRAVNLEWVTHGDNLLHAYETGLMPNNTSPRAVTATNIQTGEQITFPSIYKAARFFNISQGNICMCCKGFRPYANGYFWEYAT